jgi:triacylglycerol lipase
MLVILPMPLSGDAPAPLPVLTPLWREIGGVWGLLGLRRERPFLEASATGAPVLLIPGFLTGDQSLSTLATHLVSDGLRPWPAGVARNIGCSEATTRTLLERLDWIAARYRSKVTIVGHSRGGLMARVLARRRPELVAGVVTLAAPHREPLAIHPLLWLHGIALGAASLVGVRGLLRFSCIGGACCAHFRADLAAPAAPGVEYVSVYSRRDGLVDWRACVDASARNVEVGAGHCHLTTDRATLEVVADAVKHFAVGSGQAERRVCAA